MEKPREVTIAVIKKEIETYYKMMQVQLRDQMAREINMLKQQLKNVKPLKDPKFLDKSDREKFLKIVAFKRWMVIAQVEGALKKMVEEVTTTKLLWAEDKMNLAIFKNQNTMQG